MSELKSYKDLIVWQKSMLLAEDCYKITTSLPKHELYALGDQIRRSAVSIPSNVAEGSKRHNTREFYQFCGIALGSSAEFETQLLLASSIYKIDSVSARSLLEEIQKMLTKLSKQLKLKV